MRPPQIPSSFLRWYVLREVIHKQSRFAFLGYLPGLARLRWSKAINPRFYTRYIGAFGYCIAHGLLGMKAGVLRFYVTAEGWRYFKKNRPSNETARFIDQASGLAKVNDR